MIYKLDPKIKYQNPSFKKKLQKAQHYKRPVRNLSKNKLQRFLSAIGLRGFFARAVLLVLALFLIYLVYIPNFLFIKHINITGIAVNDAGGTQKTAEKYLRSKYYWPQNNLLLLSKAGLSEYIAKNNTAVLKVIKINKKFPDALEIEIQPRYEKFSVKSGSFIYSVANDGLVLGKNPIADLVSASTSAGNLINISTLSDEDFALKQQFLNEQWLNGISEIKNQLPKLTGSVPLNFEFADFGSPSLTVYMPKKYKIFFDLNSDMAQTLKEYQVLWNRLSDDQKNRLFYIDFRIAGKSYVCYKQTACSEEIAPLTNEANATTTPK